MSHASNKENEVVGLVLGHNSCNVEEHVYWPGKTILKLYLVLWAHLLCLEIIDYSHTLKVCGRIIKKTMVWLQLVCLVQQAVFWATVEEEGGVWLCSTTCHFSF